ncbi:unnamed protein product, partial [Timema podura]|nr:unnamed protein product [Timema podura]
MELKMLPWTYNLSQSFIPPVLDWIASDKEIRVQAQLSVLKNSFYCGDVFRLFFHFFLPSSLLDSCCSLIISALSSVHQILMSLSAAMYSSYVQSGDNLCHVSSSHSRVKVWGAEEGAVDEPGCGSIVNFGMPCRSAISVLVIFFSSTSWMISYFFLSNYRLDFHGAVTKRWGGCSATIVPDNNHYVWGVIWELDNSDMPKSRQVSR